MKKCWNIAVFSLVLAFFAGRVARARIAVFPFEDLTRGTAGINMAVSRHVSDLLTEMGYQVVPPEEIVTFMALNRLRWTGWSDRVTARKMEKTLRARFILMGTVLEEDVDRKVFGVCARILKAPDYRLVWGRTVAMSELGQISLLGLKKLTWKKMESVVLQDMLKRLPSDLGGNSVPEPDVGVVQMYLHPHHAQSGKKITCGVKLDISGDPPENLSFVVGKDRVLKAVKSKGYWRAAWTAPRLEGSYPVRLIARWSAHLKLEKRINLATFFVDNHPPKFQLKLSHGQRLPGGFAFRRHVRIVPALSRGEPIARWRFEIVSVKEKVVTLLEEAEGHVPAAFVWRGTDGTGSVMPNGPYIVRVTIWDLAGNQAQASARLLLVRQLPEVTVEAVAEEKEVEVAVIVGKHPVPMTDWRFEIWDREGNLVARREGEGVPNTFKIPKKNGLRYTLEMRDDFGNRLILRNRKLKVVKAGAYGVKTKKLKRWINEF